MNIISPNKRRLVGLIALIGLGSVARFVESDRTPLIGIAAEGEYLQADGPALLNDQTRQPSAPILAPEEGFNAFEGKDPPPAELLALGDWPLDPSGRDAVAGRVSDVAVGSTELTAGAAETAVEASALAQAAAEQFGPLARERVGEATPEGARGAAPTSDQSQNSEQVTISPIAAISFPKVIENDVRVAEGQTTEGIMQALIEAFDASGTEKPGVAAAPAAPPRAEMTDSTLGAVASVQTAGPRDKAQDFLRSIEANDSVVGRGIRQVVSKSRDLVGEFIAFLGFGGAEKQTAENQATAIAKVVKQKDAAHEDIPSVPDGARAVALGSAPVKSSVFGDERIVLSAASLDHMRGGFESSDGFIKMGIEKATYINGSLVTYTSLNVDNLAKIAGGGVGVTATGTPTLAVVQNGPNNSYQTSAIPSGIGHVIQNTLDGADIKSDLRITTTVNSLEMLKAVNFHASLRDALVRSTQR